MGAVAAQVGLGDLAVGVVAATAGAVGVEAVDAVAGNLVRGAVG